MPMMRSRPNNGCEGDYNECCISAAYSAYYRPKKPVPEFTSDKLKVFLICSLLKDIFVRIFWIVIIFFLYKNVNVSYLVAYVN